MIEITRYNQNMRIQNLLTDNTTLLEIYFINHQDDNPITTDIRTSTSVIHKIQQKYKTCKTTKYMTYAKNELTYIYDLTDDHQTVITKLRENVMTEANLHAISYKYSKLPTHLFPCVADIDYAIEYTISEYKLTNRLSIIIRTDDYGQYAYIEYKHSPSVDIDKIESSVQNILQTLK